MNLGSASPSKELRDMRQPKESFAFLFLKEMPLRCEAMVGGWKKELGIVW